MHMNWYESQRTWIIAIALLVACVAAFQRRFVDDINELVAKKDVGHDSRDNKSQQLRSIHVEYASVELISQPKQSLCWTTAGESITISPNGFVAKKNHNYDLQIVTCCVRMMTGLHYMEVKLIAGYLNFIGVVRPGLNHDEYYYHTTDAFYIRSDYGSISGNGHSIIDGNKTGRFAVGDCIGVLLDLDAGWLRFYRNGKRVGPGFTENVKGPLLWGVEMGGYSVVEMRPHATAPE